MTYADDYNIRTTSVKFNDIADALDGLLTRNYTGTTTGTADAYIATPTPSWDSYVTSSFIVINPHVTNNANATINVSGLGAKNIKRAGVNVSAGALTANIPTILIYTGVHFEILIIENAIKQDGTNSATANINFGGFLPTNVGAGTASLPAYCAGNDTNTGMYSPSADAIGFANNGSDTLRITSTGLVGVATTTPKDALQVGSYSTITKTDSGGANGTILGFNHYYSSGSKALATGNRTVTVELGNNGGILKSTTATQTADSALSGMNSYIQWGGSTDNILFATGGTERMQIDNAGRVGIGATSISELLHLRSATPRIRLEDTDAGGAYGNISGNGTGGNIIIQADPSNAAAGTTIAFDIDGTTRATISSDGNMGIGVTPTSAFRLLLKGSDQTTTNYGLNVQDSAGNDNFYIRNDGLVGTGDVTNSPYNRTTATAANLVVQNGGFLARSTSSLKYKTDVMPYTKGLAEVLSLNPVFYKGTNDGGTQFAGLIAEEVDAAGLVEFVQYAADGTPDALAYSNMVALAFAAIKQLNAKVDALEARVATLEAGS